MTRRIDIFTGGRADWGLLSVPARALAATPGVAVAVIATGQHAGAQGTLAAVQQDFQGPVGLVDMGIADDSGAALSHAMARLQHGLTDHLAEARPDLLLLLGDRYEVLTAATVATMLSIPIAHIAGGDVTEGAMDDALRHAISKLSHLHFATTHEARRRLLAMGEQPDRVVVSGSPGIDRLLGESQIDRHGFFQAVGLEPRQRNIVVAFHPVTLADNSMDQLRGMLGALAHLGDEIGIIFTGVNADPGFLSVDTAIAEFCSGRANAVRRASLGSHLYANALRHCDAVVGNSSSGLYEAPTFRTPTVNIGDRQAGRLRAASVIDCDGAAQAVLGALHAAFALDCSGVTNPYGDGTAGAIIARHLAGLDDPRRLLRKRFHDSRMA